MRAPTRSDEPVSEELNNALGNPGKAGKMRGRGRRLVRQRRGALATGHVTSRAIDVVIAASMLVPALPWLAYAALCARIRNGSAIERLPRVGYKRRGYSELQLTTNGLGQRLPVLWNVLRGDLSLVGPRALSPGEAIQLPPAAALRFAVRPGLVSPHTLRRGTGIDYEGEQSVDHEYVHRESLKGKIGLLMRAVLVALLSGSGNQEVPDELTFFGVRVWNTTMDDATGWIVEAARTELPTRAAFVNPDCLNLAYNDETYRQALKSCQRVLPDGIGIRLGCRVQGVGMKSNVNGTDMYPRLCEAMAEAGQSLFLLGAKPGVAQCAADAMQKEYPNLRIAGTRDGYFAAEEEASVIEAINLTGASVMLVAFGAPRQETWIAAHRDALTIPVCIGVGGLFDFYSGRVTRAPQWVREIGLEWAWRMGQEPGRLWRRYVIGNPLFLYRVRREMRRMASGNGDFG